MNIKFTIVWIGLLIAGLVIEGIALFNAKRGDTLSEHLWAWLGVRNNAWKCGPDSNAVTPVWTLRVARTLFIFFMAWFTLHITMGGWV